MSVSLVGLIQFGLALYANILFARIILSWIPIEPPSALRSAFNFLYDITDPFLRLFRGLLPPIGGLDLSPILAFIVIRIAAGLVGTILG